MVSSKKSNTETTDKFIEDILKCELDDISKNNGCEFICKVLSKNKKNITADEMALIFKLIRYYPNNDLLYYINMYFNNTKYINLYYNVPNYSDEDLYEIEIITDEGDDDGEKVTYIWKSKHSNYFFKMTSVYDSYDGKIWTTKTWTRVYPKEIKTTIYVDKEY